MAIAKSGDIGPLIVPTLTTLNIRKKQANVVILDNDDNHYKTIWSLNLGTQSGTLYD